VACILGQPLAIDVDVTADFMRNPKTAVRADRRSAR